MQSEPLHRVAPSGVTRRYLALDSLRGVCACIVVLYHLPTTGLITNSAFVEGGWMFVDFFFVLSGFVISAGYATRLANGFPVSTFMALRLGRVYPLHIAMLLLYLAMEGAAYLVGDTGGLARREAFGVGRDLGSWFTNAALMQIFGIQDTLTWNIPSWSIAAEMWTYLLMSLLLHHFGAGRRMLVVVAVAVGVSLATLAALGEPYLDRTYSWALLRCVYGFGLGMLGYRLHDIAGRARALDDRVATGLELAIVAMCVVFVSCAGGSIVTLACPPLFAVTVLVFAREEGRISAALRTRLPVLLGSLSYSIYMIHHFVEGRILDSLKVIGSLSGHPLVTWIGRNGWQITLPTLIADLAAIATLAAVVACSFITYRLIEEPCRRWSRRVAMRHSAGSAETVTPSL